MANLSPAIIKDREKAAGLVLVFINIANSIS